MRKISFTLFLLLLSTAFQFILAQTKPNLKPYTPTAKAWSDPLVVTKDSGTYINNTVYANENVFISFAIINNSTVAIPAGTKFYVQILVDGVSVYESYWDQGLLSTYYVFWSDINIGKFSVGSHTFKLVADSRSNIDESDETDNVFTLTKTFTLNETKPNLKPYKPQGWSDELIVTNDSGSYTNKTVYANQDVFITFAVDNNGMVEVPVGKRYYVLVLADDVQIYESYTDQGLSLTTYSFWHDKKVKQFSSGSHTFKLIIDSRNNIDESDETDNTFILTKTFLVLDTDPPVISHTPSGNATLNTPYAITATATDQSAIKYFYVQYRISSDLWNDNNEISFTSGSAAIPANFVTEKGFDYRIYAEDAIGNGGYWWHSEKPGSTITYNSVSVIVPADRITGTQTMGGTDISAYRLFSVPEDFGTITASDLFKNLGTVKKDWRLRALSNGTTWIDGETSPVQKGSSYFLITRNSTQIKPSLQGLTSKASYYDFVGIPVKIGWNLIGNPFSFQVAINNLRLLNPADEINSPVPESWVFSGSGWEKANYLYPWSGIAVYSETETYLQFWIGYASLGKYSTINDKNKILKNDGRNWAAQVIVRNDEIMDKENYFGVQENAKDLKDDLDAVEPPILEEGVSAYFPHLDWKNKPNIFCQDFREIDHDGNNWDLNIQCGKKDSKFTVEFRDLEKIPDLYLKYLFDIDRSIAYNLSGQNVITSTSGSGLRKFKIIVGKENYFNQNFAGLKTVPKEFALSQNFPNPFNPYSTIRFNLPTDSHVNLNVFDTYGRLVVNLINERKPAGSYETIFDGSKLSSGIYYYKIEVNGEKSFVDTKKMILLK